MSRPAGKKLTASLEDYLEAILILVRRGRVARVRDIALGVGVGKSSVTAALKTLAGRKLVNYDPYQVVTLTDKGRDLAEEVSRRHFTLRQFLADVLQLDSDLAEANACRMEHAVDDAVLSRLVRLGEFMRSCPRVKDSWLEDFPTSCRSGTAPQRCHECMTEQRPPVGPGGRDAGHE